MTQEEQLISELQLLSHDLAEQFITQEVFEKEKAAIVEKFTRVPSAGASLHLPQTVPRLSEVQGSLALDAEQPVIDTAVATAALTTMYPNMDRADVEAALQTLCRVMCVPLAQVGQTV
jgi:hypothetical protein